MSPWSSVCNPESIRITGVCWLTASTSFRVHRTNGSLSGQVGRDRHLGRSDRKDDGLAYLVGREWCAYSKAHLILLGPLLDFYERVAARCGDRIDGQHFADRIPARLTRLKFESGGSTRGGDAGGEGDED